ncbi:type II 3-dehydroquinate dehydratase [Candidatus Nitrosacidococcus tergens]|uniref:3-dehydroquinate dehydratase n=1 Tax=Candidatus Nitrosacidococcus tergens TaxID=553981 RepID=A0A7G1QB73_9GAMM|nr:type II 3-dehydroquinate dehydratase [Candidatus Nitrosacidococcus tergens]CAB1277193.1 3-dehydroquinate dehydratase [Candidatus Nitrosacidococcus tergens]
MAQLLILHGPNLNLLGVREPDHYGVVTLETINASLAHQAVKAGVDIVCFQSNAEHELIEHIHNAVKKNTKFIIINPAAFTHTSVALRDSLLAAAIPFIEVHISNIYKREEFRHHSYFSDIAEGVISGLGAMSYELALQAALTYISSKV